MAETLSRRPVDMVSKDSLRKSKKPLMEKRRRLRINTCLNQLKTLVLQALNKDGSHFSKLEKADILEMTVKYLRGIQRSQMGGQMSGNPSTQAAKYRAGFNECANEVVRYVHSVHGVNDEVRSRLMGHLASCMHVVNATPDGQPPRVPLQPLYVQVPNTGVSSAPEMTTPVSAAVAARQNLILWSQQQQQHLPVPPMVPPTMTPPSGSRSPPFVSPYSTSSRSSSPSSSIPSPSYSEMSPSPEAIPRMSPHFNDSRSSPKPSMTPQQQRMSAAEPSAVVKCKEENVWRPW